MKYYIIDSGGRSGNLESDDLQLVFPSTHKDEQVQRFIVQDADCGILPTEKS